MTLFVRRMFQCHTNPYFDTNINTCSSYNSLRRYTKGNTGPPILVPGSQVHQFEPTAHAREEEIPAKRGVVNTAWPRRMAT